jgi:8-oxo-dGTP diphosphatase
MAKAKVERSAGGVVYRDSEGQMMVVLIATRERAVWGLPKGQIEKHENRLEAALREVREETGLRTEHVADLGYIEYWYRDSDSKVLYHKFVDYFLLRYVSGDVSEHGWEVDEARWLSIDEAMDRISYDNERKVLQRAQQSWGSLSPHGD